jgi:SAM-dependent methyltransferase
VKGPLPYSLVIGLSAFLLFLLEPLYAKALLPWFGGSSSVWSLCLVFFQGTLLLGYAYADQLTRKLSPRKGALLHGALFLACLPLFPIGLDDSWRPLPGEDPTWKLLGLLAVRIGLPFFLLSSTGPLVQAWYIRKHPGLDPYPLFSLSNGASLLGLLFFPFLLEPSLGTQGTLVLWSALFILFAVLNLGLAWTSEGKGKDLKERTGRGAGGKERLAWVGSSACGSLLLVSFTEHLTQDISPTPLLWVLPLALYLLSFVLVFRKGGDRWVRWALFPLFPLWVVLNMAFYDPGFLPELKWEVLLGCLGLFLGCLFCHGQLAASKPDPSRLTGFYLHISLGGALGSLFAGLLAPQVFPFVWEYPLALMVVAFAAHRHHFASSRKGRALWLGLLIYLGLTFALHWQALKEGSVAMARNFYAALRVAPLTTQGGEKYLALCHGVVAHGKQFLDPAKRAQGTSYYSPSSGGALAMRFGHGPKKVGIVGLGAGTLAVYGRPGGEVRFYEIDPQVEELARKHFTFLSLSRSKVPVVLGDARLMLEAEAPQGFDVLAVDAFSGDAIPTHLLTREAFLLYQRHLKSNGILAFHTSNRHLKLGWVVLALAREEGYEAVVVRNPKDEEQLVDVTEWVLVTKDQAFLKAVRSLVPGPQPQAPQGLKAWTDDRNSLFPLLR